MERKKAEYVRCLNIPSYTVEWRGTERRGALEPWRRRQKKADKKLEKTVGMDGQSN